MPLFDTLLSLLAPHYCLVCGHEGQLLCVQCEMGELLPVPSRCYRCKQAVTDSKVCTKCRRLSPLKHVWVRTEYNDTTSKPVIAYKFERARAAYAPLARAMITALPYMGKNTLIVGVPSATNRVRERGYDHVDLLAREITTRTKAIYSRPAVRMGQMQQFGSSRKTRLEQLDGAFWVTKPQEVAGKRVLIIDDVLTTGATLETFAKVLHAAGAAHIDALVFAQKM